MVAIDHFVGQPSFNPSQVGYKLVQIALKLGGDVGFNPSQVGYKLEERLVPSSGRFSFNPSQVGYKHEFITFIVFIVLFQSLTGRLQTLVKCEI